MSEHYPMPAPQDERFFGAHIQRTMKLLATSTPERRNPVKIMVYGQSIAKQEWWEDLVLYLRARFPYADLTMVNRSVGGFSAERLIKSVEYDLYPFFPDLMIFHVFGNEANYEAIIARLRSTTTCEVMLQTDHVQVASEEGAKSHEYRSNEWLPHIARKYGCELVDIRNPWKKYLQDNGLRPEELLLDGAHLNKQGVFLMAELTRRYFKYRPGQPVQDGVIDYIVGKDIRWEKGRLLLPFEGTRVDVLPAAGEASAADVWVDGRRPSDCPGCYACTRPNDLIGLDWPWFVGSVTRIGWNTPPVAEDWTATVTSIDRTSGTFRYEVRGSVTGYDGDGSGSEDFVSNSGRVTIKAADWWFMLPDGSSFLSSLKEGFQVKWKVIPMFLDRYEAVPIPDPVREYPVTLIQGLENGRHVLELTACGREVPVRAIRVYKPPFTQTGK